LGSKKHKLSGHLLVFEKALGLYGNKFFDQQQPVTVQHAFIGNFQIIGKFDLRIKNQLWGLWDTYKPEK
jgi:hypothetical protein